MNKDSERVPPEVIKHFQRKMAEQEMLKQAGILIPLVTPIIVKGEGVRAFGRKVYANRPSDETFHIFLISILQSVLGKEWWDEQQKLPINERHFIATCFDKFNEWMEKSRATAQRLGKTNIWSAVPDGYAKSLILLAFDVVSLSHMQDLPDSLLQRLISKDQYQGARYEIAIAGIFARLGCQITFTDEKSQEKRCEFIAKHHEFNFELAVEVKSRHRQGVLHQAGIRPDQDDLMSARPAWRLFKDALEQNPKDMPFVIFIDVNSPLTPNLATDEKQWVKDAKELVTTKLKDLPAEEHPNAIFFTNFSHHYQTENEALQGESICIFTSNPKFSKPDPKFVDALLGGVNHYGYVPAVELEQPSTETGIPTIYE